MSFVCGFTWEISGDIFYYENGTKKICKHIEDNGTIGLGETIVAKYYRVDNCSNLPAGGVHLSIVYEQVKENIFKIDTKIWADCIKCKHFPICNEVSLIINL